VNKHRTEIGPRSFIGSNTMLVAPVKIGRDAMTGSGSVITQDVPAEAVALGRARQVNKPGLAVKLLDLYQSIKDKRLKGTK
jgi:bifunctional UDP-N-acetylglucosamine pyrophosphorylase/glucosamine-1-phosphate N-acetyltransferase